MAKKAAKKKATKGQHGGAREGAGRRAFFPGADVALIIRVSESTQKKIDAQIAAMNKTVEKGDLRASRNSLFEALYLMYGKSITLDDMRRISGQ